MRRSRAIVALVLVACTVAIAEPASGASDWTAPSTPSPFRPRMQSMTGVACASKTSCFAVGQYDDGYRTIGNVIERWDGKIWRTSSRVAGNGRLAAVSCPTAILCFAVGSNSNHTLVKRWNGSKWNAVASPDQKGSASELRGVSCASATRCFAVGMFRGGGVFKTLVELWDGKSWKIVKSPNPNPYAGAGLNAVSCPDANRCYAVGAANTSSSKPIVLVETWNGSGWFIVPAPTPPYHYGQGFFDPPALASVSCASSTQCIAVGHSDNALIERWNGREWNVVPSATPPSGGGRLVKLRAVSCASSSECMAVGTNQREDNADFAEVRNSIAERWDGTSWKVVPKPAVVPTNTEPDEFGQLNDLAGVSCPATSCAAVGTSSMAERWDGARWSLAPLDSSDSLSALHAVSCPAPAMCLAVGAAAPMLADAQNVLAQRWDGAKWSIVPSATPSGGNVVAELDSISCVTPTDCTAVGIYTPRANIYGFRNTRPLIEHWDGAKWSTVSSPNPSPETYYLGRPAVSCASAADCWIVGVYDTYDQETDTNAEYLLGEHWNGTAWSLVPIAGAGALQSVSCSSATSCVAVGNDGHTQALTMHWDGAAWSRDPNASAPGTSDYPTSVSCVSSSDCTLVGTRASSQPDQLLIEHWDGANWSLATSPALPGTSSPSLSGVSCTSATSCTAVGWVNGYTTPPRGTPLIVQWDGVTWSVAEAAPLPSGTAGAVLNGVGCSGATACAAVGARGVAASSFTFAEQHR